LLCQHFAGGKPFRQSRERSPAEAESGFSQELTPGVAHGFSVSLFYTIPATPLEGGRVDLSGTSHPSFLSNWQFAICNVLIKSS
jgi:hypothetical protein